LRSQLKIDQRKRLPATVSKLAGVFATLVVAAYALSVSPLAGAQGETISLNWPQRELKQKIDVETLEGVPFARATEVVRAVGGFAEKLDDAQRYLMRFEEREIVLAEHLFEEVP